MESTRILAIIVAAAPPGAVLLAQDEHGKMGDMMKEHPAKMSEMHQKMEADMKAQNAELDKLVSEMNATTADKKADAMAFEKMRSVFGEMRRRSDALVKSYMHQTAKSAPHMRTSAPVKHI